LFHDGRDLEHATEIRADVCIVGAGAAGIAIAREFIGQRRRVALLTSGGLEFERRVQRLYAGENVGRPSFSTFRSRVRMFGGSTTRWTGQCRPLEREDFERRDWIPYSGWPFSRDDLEPFYRRAQVVCALGPYEYGTAAWSSNGVRPLPVDSSHLDVRIYQFSHPTDFGKAYHAKLEAAANVDVYLHADVTEIEVDGDARRVTGLIVATSPDARVRFTADQYVLACGGIENARLLLASHRVAKAGLGNAHDLVGRYYMDHPFFFAGWFEPARPELEHTLHVVDYGRVGWEQRAHAALALPEHIRRAERLNDCAIYFVRRPSYKTEPAYFGSGVQSLAGLADVMTGIDPLDRSALGHLRGFVTGLPDVGRTLGRRVLEAARPRSRLALRTAIETTPNPESRVRLGRRRDSLGMPTVVVDWRINDDDRRGVARLYEVARAELDRLGIGTLVENVARDAEGWPTSMTGGMHHMGTTRMHDDPRQGVVDTSARVHDLANLYVAGSSVFPTGGVANPTLTIVALAIRLADHLKRVAPIRH
jgi:choline dehydrogenase-like flavoprotein